MVTAVITVNIVIPEKKQDPQFLVFWGWLTE